MGKANGQGTKKSANIGGTGPKVFKAPKKTKPYFEQAPKENTKSTTRYT